MGTVSFRFWSVLGLVALVVVIAVFSYLRLGLLSVSSCPNTSRDCLGAAIVFGLLLVSRSVIMIVFTVFMSILVFSRSRDAGMSMFWVLPALIFFVAAAGYLTGFGDFYGAHVRIGIVRTELIMLAGFVALLVFLSFYNSIRLSGPPRTSVRIALIMAGVAAVIIVTMHIWHVVQPFYALPGVRLTIDLPLINFHQFISGGLRPLHKFLPMRTDMIAILVFIAALGYVLYAMWRDRDTAIPITEPE